MTMAPFVDLFQNADIPGIKYPPREQKSKGNRSFSRKTAVFVKTFRAPDGKKTAAAVLYVPEKRSV